MNTAAISNNQSVTMNSVNANEKSKLDGAFQSVPVRQRRVFCGRFCNDDRKCFCSSADHENSKTIKQREKKLRFRRMQENEKKPMLETEDLRREHTEQSRIHQSAFF